MQLCQIFVEITPGLMGREAFRMQAVVSRLEGMPMLYLVRVETEMVVEADDALDAEDAARRNLRDEADNATYDAEPLTDKEHLPPDWRDAYPYEGYGLQTCSEILGG